MKRLSQRNYELISEGAKMLGTLNPQEIFPVFEERLYIKDTQAIWDFLEWCNKYNKTFGWGNYQEVFAEYKSGVVSDKFLAEPRVKSKPLTAEEMGLCPRCWSRPCQCREGVTK